MEAKRPQRTWMVSEVDLEAAGLESATMVWEAVVLETWKQQAWKQPQWFGKHRSSKSTWRQQAWRRAWKLFFLLVGDGALRAGPGAGLRVMLLLLPLVQRTKGEGGGGCVGWNLHFWVCSLAFCDGQPVCAMHGRRRAGRTLMGVVVFFLCRSLILRESGDPVPGLCGVCWCS